MTAPRTAVVTGAASGIGASCARTLSEHGWKVAGIDLRPSGTDLSLTVDVTDRVEVGNAVDRVQARWGSVDLLVTAAGYDERIPVAEISKSSWDRILAVLLGGTVNACAAVLAHMRRQRAASIVAISSELGLAGSADNVHYAAAKGAVIGFVKALALECALDGIAVNSVAPGPTDTPPCWKRSPPGVTRITWPPCRCDAWCTLTRWPQLCCSSPRREPTSAVRSSPRTRGR